MNQNLRMSLTIFLCASIYFVWLTWFAPKPVPQTAQVAQTQQSVDATNTSPLPVGTAASITALTNTDAAETKVAAQEIVLENSKAQFTLTTEGAKFVSAIFNDYHTEADRNTPYKNILTETPDSSALYLGVENLNSLTDKKIYQVVGQDKNKVVLQWQNAKVRVQKTFALSENSSDYALHASYQITNLSNEDLDLTPYWQNQVTQKVVKNHTGILGFLSKSSTQAEEFLPNYFKENSAITNHDWQNLKTLEDQTQWAGITDRYFLLALAPLPVKTEWHKTKFERDGEILKLKIFANTQTVAPGTSITGETLSYMGPRKPSELKLLGVNLEKAVDYGWFGVLAMPILWLMQTIHSILPSWGLAIILLTFIVKILLHPVNKKSMASMKAMQQLQPKLEEIRKKFPDDKMKQNEQVMQLFKTHKVNPLGGCLPMLLQMPIYFALYRVLWNAVELYHTPFLHYKDLSAPDPYFIAPIIMGVFMFLQQQLTPNPSTDPVQKKMMMFMPIMFTGIMLFLPVGLVIYICVNTAMSVFQQYLMRKDLTLRQLVFRKKLVANGM